MDNSKHFTHPADRPDNFFQPGDEIAVCDPFFEHEAMAGVFVCDLDWSFFQVHSLNRNFPSGHEISDQRVIFLARSGDIPLVLEAGLHDFNIMRKDEFLYLEDHPEEIADYLDTEPSQLDQHLGCSYKYASRRFEPFRQSA